MLLRTAHHHCHGLITASIGEASNKLAVDGFSDRNIQFIRGEWQWALLVMAVQRAADMLVHWPGHSHTLAADKVAASPPGIHGGILVHRWWKWRVAGINLPALISPAKS